MTPGSPPITRLVVSSKLFVIKIVIVSHRHQSRNILCVTAQMNPVLVRPQTKVVRDLKVQEFLQVRPNRNTEDKGQM